MKKRLAGIFLFLVLSSCAQREQALAPLPEGMTLEPGTPRFSLDTVTAVHEFAVKGHAQMKLQAVLSGPNGKRALYLETPTERKLVAEAGYNLPPASATNDAGKNVTCWNSLPEKAANASDITDGSLPDPRAGLFINCQYDTGTMTSTFSVGELQHVAWLRDVTAHNNAVFRISFYTDQGWLGTDPALDHGYWIQDFDSNLQKLSSPVQIQPSCPAL